MYKTLSILLRNSGLHLHKDIFKLIIRYFRKIDKICLILTICPNFRIKKNIKGDLFHKASENGNLGVMKYMFDNNFPYDSQVFNYAADNRSLDHILWKNMMKWLLDNNFPYDECVFARAAKNGSLDNMKWLLENNFPYDIYVFAYAATHGSLDNMKWKNTMEWLLENNFPYDKSMLLILSGDLVVKDWINTNL